MILALAPSIPVVIVAQAIIGLGDLAMSRELHPALTSVRVDGTLIGHTAAQYIMQRADGLTVAEPVCDVGFTIVERATT